MTEEKQKLSAGKCLQHARMLVPKFSIEDGGSWYIHWPKDQAHVVDAKTEKELIVKLATWFQVLGRVANQGKHVDPEYP